MNGQLQLKKCNVKWRNLKAVLGGILSHSQSSYVRGVVNLLNRAAKRTENSDRECFEIPLFRATLFDYTITEIIHTYIESSQTVR